MTAPRAERMMLRDRQVRTLLAALQPERQHDESKVKKYRRRWVNYQYPHQTSHQKLALVVLIFLTVIARYLVCSSVNENHRRITFLDGPPNWPRTSWIDRSASRKTRTLLERRSIVGEPTDDFSPHKEPCPHNADWQRRTSPRPTCNSVHEVGPTYSWIAAGAYKDVWKLDDQVILKSSVWNFEFSSSNLKRHQKDALVMDETSTSPYVLNLYAYCAFSSLVEAAQMTLKQWLLQERPSPPTLLRMATHMAQALADVHLYRNGLPTFVHADLKASQYLVISTQADRQFPIVKLNDFNRGRFLAAQNQTLCPFVVSTKHRGSTNRSPEEYQYHAPLTDKIDVFSFGSTLYEMVTGWPPFPNLTFEDGKRKILNGVPPPLPDVTDPNLLILIHVLQQCRQYRPEDRPTSRQVATLLASAQTV